MSLKLTINEDMKQYMKDKDTVALEAIRMLKSEIKYVEIDQKKELDDEGIIKVIQSTIKKNKEAAEIYDKAGRTDLRDKENRYSEVLAKYMPEQLDKAQLVAIVKSVIAEMGNVDPKTGFGAVIKTSMSKVGSRADGKLVSAVVKEVLDGHN